MAFGRYSDLLRERGFQALLWTQFLGALNDSVYKIVVTLLALTAATSNGGGGRELALVGAVFILPFFLFSGYAGHLADVHNKRTILIATKSLEAGSMLLAVLALYLGRFDLMLLVLFLMALQSTLFSPAKYGVLPEMVADKDLSRANALIQMSTNLAIIAGTWIGGELLGVWRERTWLIGCLLTLVALIGFAASFGISKVPDPRSRKPFSLNPWSEILEGFRYLRKDKPLWLTVLGISYFWMLGALLQLDIILFARDLLQVTEEWSARLITFLGVGIALGSMAAGRLSGDKVELGLTPLGSIGMGFAGLWLASSGNSYTWAAVSMGFLGFAGGLFIVPLSSLLQQRSDPKERGRLIATNNFFNMFGVLLASGALYLLADVLAFSPDRIVGLFGWVTFAVTLYMLTLIPDFLIRFVLWGITHTFYRIRIVGQENVPFRGPALLVSNHVSLIDGFFVGACVQRFIRFLVYRPYYEQQPFHWVLRKMNAIPIQGGDPEKVAESIELAREQLRQGHIVCIFAEGSVSRTGGMLPFKHGFERIMEGLHVEGLDVDRLDVPIIPVNLDRVWGSIFSFKDGRPFFRWPEHFPYPVTVSFGAPLPSFAKAGQVRQAVLELGSEAAALRRSGRDQLHLRFIRTAKRGWFRFAVADGHRRMKYGSVLVESLLLARRLRKAAGHGVPTPRRRIGLRLPPSTEAVLANLAVLFAGWIPVNLPRDASPDQLSEIAGRCGIRTVIGSRRAPIEPGMRFEEALSMEELASRRSGVGRAIAAAAVFLLPARLLQAACQRKENTPDSLATVVHTAGVSGAPKSVMLSHYNIISNVEAFEQIFWVNRQDRVAGSLPFHHALGLTATLWFPLLAGCGVLYHDDPADASGMGQLAGRYGGTILVARPVQYSAYLSDVPPEDFRMVRSALVGGSVTEPDLARRFQEKFGVELIEGYGLAEMTAVVAVNVPDYEHGRGKQVGSKLGTVGHPVPGVSAKVVDDSTGETLPGDQEGLLLVKGPGRMLGYLDGNEREAASLRNGWLETGDRAAMDGDGFIRIIVS